EEAAFRHIGTCIGRDLLELIHCLDDRVCISTSIGKVRLVAAQAAERRRPLAGDDRECKGVDNDRVCRGVSCAGNRLSRSTGEPLLQVELDGRVSSGGYQGFRQLLPPRYDDLEQKLFAAPVIAVPTITIASDFDGAAADGASYAKKFSGKYSHRILKGIGHNVPQEAPQAFAQAVVEVNGY